MAPPPPAPRAGLAAAVLALSGATGCAPSAIDGGFDSPNSSARIYAIERAARDGDRSAVPRIVEQLDSDDPAVRLVAIGALERLTGETLGYEAEDPPEARREAIKRWVEFVDEQDAPSRISDPRHP